MLRLESAGKKSDVTLTIRIREKHLSRSLLTAFAIAFTIHAGSLLLFDIESFRFGGPFTAAPPTSVLAILSQQESGTTGAVITANDTLYRRHTPLPPPMGAPINDDALLHPISASDALFALQDPVCNPFIHEHTRLHPLLIRISGPLGESTLLDRAPEESLIETVATSLAVTYDVRVDGPTGKIVRVVNQTLSGDKKMLKEADSILRSLSFEPSKQQLIKGIIEIQLARG